MTAEVPDPDPPTARIPPPPFLAEPAPAAVLAALPGSRAVGGCVRDALAGREIQDVDVAVPLPPEAIAARLREAGLKVFETGLAHGTVTAVRAHQPPVEVTSLRRDVATDGRHAEVEWTTDWREDAARRDFTINAMSLAADGRLWDYHGGREDLAAGRVRFVGDPATRLAEDYLRALRFFRFQARYGRGEPDPAALAAIRAAVPGLARLSAERVWMELKRLLAAPDPAGAVALMAETGVLGAVLPEATELPALARLVERCAPRDPLLRLAALLGSPSDLHVRKSGGRPSPEVADGQALAARLRFSGEEATRLAALCAPAPDPAAEGDDLRRLLAERPGDDLALLGWLAEARDLPGDWAGFRARVAGQPRLELPVLGRDVLAAGVAPGPRVGALLAELREWWKAGGCTADREACLERLRELAGSGRV